MCIGCGPELEGSVAKFPAQKRGLALRDNIHDRKIFTVANYLSKKPTRVLSRMQAKNEVVEIFNSPEIRSASQPAISGVGTARGLARTFELFMDGVLVSKSLLQRISKPQFENVFDHGLGKEESKGYGFVYTKSSMNSWQIGHPAIGGQRVYMDPADRLVVCYLTNGVKSWEGDNPTTFENLQLEVYSTLKRQHSCSAENIDRALQGKLP